MDTFFEQIIAMKKGAKQILALTGIWLAFLIIAAVAILFIGVIGMMFDLIIIFLFGYLAYFLSSKLFIEYEYIITNGSFDIDKIIAKKKRKRIASFELSDVESITRYNRNARINSESGLVFDVCNVDDEAYEMRVSSKKGGSLKVIFAPNERMKGAVVKFIPKYIANSAFKD